MLNIRELRELNQAKAIIESFAPPNPVVTDNRPMRIGTRQVIVWAIPVRHIKNEQLIAVRVV